MAEDKHEHEVPEPHRTKTRDELGSREAARRWLDGGGHLEGPEQALYRHMRESQRRLMVILPVLMSVGIMAMRSREGRDVSEDISNALDASASLASQYLNPVTREEQLTRIVADAQDVLVTMDATSIRNAVLGAAYLVLALVDQERVPDPGAQSVLTALAITEEAQADAQAGVRGMWEWNEGRAQQMVNRGIEKLSFRGYL